MPNPHACARICARGKGVADASVDPFESLELLAPAGNMTCLHAAVCAGANAVYLGCEGFNARRGADNFTLDTLAEACDYAHLRGVRVYLTLNVVVMPGEEDDVIELARKAHRCGVDAFIVQDIGVASALLRAIPDAHLHVSTQMNTHNTDGVRAAAELGAKRVTLARELTLFEVAQLAREAHVSGLDVEAFAHGALCVCYSGQCFMSSLIGGRSANRGMCAQACRLPYTLHSAAAKGALPAKGKSLLSPKDLCAIDLVCDLAEAGVGSLKVEGRMKSPEYVFAVVGVYRAVIDRMAAVFDSAFARSTDRLAAFRAVREAGIGATEDERRILSEAFSRGFTQGYLRGHRGNDIMSYQRPNNRGVFVGRVVRVEGSSAIIDSSVDLHEGDVLEFWTNKGHCTLTLDASCSREGGTYRLNVKERVNKGDRVFRVRDASLAFRDNPFEPRVAARAQVVLRLGEPLCMVAEAYGVKVEHTGSLVEAARTKAVTEDEVRSHIDRIGNTPFRFTSLKVDVEEGVGIGFSALHKVRAQTLSLLEEALLAGKRSRPLPKELDRELDKEPNKEFNKALAKRPLRPACTDQCRVVALVTNPACAGAAKRAGADAVYVSALNRPKGQACLAGRTNPELDEAYPKGCITAMPVIDKLSMNEGFDFDPWKFAVLEDTLFVESFAQIRRGLQEGLKVEVGPHIPVTNRLTLDAMAQAGVSLVWLSPELSLEQIGCLSKCTSVSLGLTVLGYQELMITEHCLLMSQGSCDKHCSSCARRERVHFLKDRKGYHFQVVTDLCGRSHLYNAVQLDAAHLAKDLIAAGISAFMVDTTLMDVKRASAAVSRVVHAREAALKGHSAIPKAEDCTTGRLFRSVS